MAFLYARRNSDPELLAAYRPADGERPLLAAARRALARAGVPAGRSRVFTVSARLGLLHAPLRAGEFTGLAFANEPALRRTVLLDGEYLARRRRAGAHAEVAQLVLHETLHGTLAARADARPDCYRAELVCALDEAATTLLELWAILSAGAAAATVAALRRRAAGSGYRRQALALLDAFSVRHPLSDLPAVIARLAVCNLRYGNAAASVRLLGELTGERADARDWLARIGSV